MRKPVGEFLMMLMAGGRECILNTAQIISLQKEAGGGITILFTHGHRMEIGKGDDALWGVLCQKLGLLDTAEES